MTCRKSSTAGEFLLMFVAGDVQRGRMLVRRCHHLVTRRQRLERNFASQQFLFTQYAEWRGKNIGREKIADERVAVPWVPMNEAVGA
jgi:hypothetical protein